ncbi:MAG: hypothetical protein KGQ38_04555 [Actinomycetales bacterium]|nr:hypothetical protein [Actinomycetales bacterium]
MVDQELATESSAGTAKELHFTQAIITSAIVVALAMAFNIAFNHQIGIVADLALLLVTIFISLRIASADALASYCAPAVSWLICLLTVGQFSTNAGGSWKVKQIYLLVYGLGSHFLWIFGATVTAIVIHYFRNRKITAQLP